MVVTSITKSRIAGGAAVGATMAIATTASPVFTAAICSSAPLLSYFSVGAFFGPLGLLATGAAVTGECIDDHFFSSNDLSFDSHELEVASIAPSDGAFLL